MRSSPTKELRDPFALRALAHPLRLRMIAFLNAEGPATATRLAAEFDTSTGSTSYHLSQLAKYGLIEAARGEGGGRERPWRSAGSVRLPSTGTPEFTAAAKLLRDQSLDLWLQILESYFAQEQAESPEWREAAFLMDDAAWLTPDELNDVAGELLEVLSKRRSRNRAERPADARRVAFFVYGLPVRDPSSTDVKSGDRRPRQRRA